MTDNQNNNLNMANTTVSYLGVPSNTAIFTANTKVTTLLTNIKGTISNINQTAQQQAADTTGATVSKKQLHDIAANLAEHVTTGMMAYADDINDPVLAAAVHFTHTDFYKGTVNEISNKMQIVHDKAAGVPIASLAPFQIVANDISGLQTAITNYVNAAPQKKVLQSTTSAATDALPPLFATLRTQLKKMDNLIKTYKVAQPNFVAGYLNARKVINLGKTQQAEELHLMPHHFEAIFGKKFLEGDTFTIRNHSTVKIQIALTDNPATMPTANVITVAANNEIQATVSKDFGGVFGHWLIVNNPNDIDDTHITIILAHGKSGSQATPIGNVSA